MGGTYQITEQQGQTQVEFTGDWLLTDGISGETVAAALPVSDASGTVTCRGKVGQWDTALVLVLAAISNRCTQAGVGFEMVDLPEGAMRLTRLTVAVPEREGARRVATRDPLLERVGKRAVEVWDGVVASVTFLGEAGLALTRFVTGKAQYRSCDLWVTVQECGPRALGIVATISFLVGAILAFVGAVQLKMFGAEVYVANLVGAGMVMEMGALMTGIIMGGRTGAAFAAQLGTMQVNEEIDALRTMGIEPMEYLVVPRMLALAIMMPLLCIFADVIGILGGSVIGIFVLDVPPVLYMNQTIDSLSLWFCAQGLIKGSVFGVLIAICGCMRGMSCGRSASAVGEAATSAVVSSIVAIVLADAVLTFIFLVVG